MKRKHKGLLEPLPAGPRPAERLPGSRVGTFTQALYDEARRKVWTVISMKDDWKEVFSPSVGRALK